MKFWILSTFEYKFSMTSNWHMPNHCAVPILWPCLSPLTGVSDLAEKWKKNIIRQVTLVINLVATLQLLPWEKTEFVIWKGLFWCNIWGRLLHFWSFSLHLVVMTAYLLFQIDWGGWRIRGFNKETWTEEWKIRKSAPWSSAHKALSGERNWHQKEFPRSG